MDGDSPIAKGNSPIAKGNSLKTLIYVRKKGVMGVSPYKYGISLLFE
jgi:hypothetical protein